MRGSWDGERRGDQRLTRLQRRFLAETPRPLHASRLTSGEREVLLQVYQGARRLLAQAEAYKLALATFKLTCDCPPALLCPVCEGAEAHCNVCGRRA